MENSQIQADKKPDAGHVNSPPSTGRIVMYVPNRNPLSPKEQVWASIVVCVIDAETVNLQAFPDHPGVQYIPNVKYSELKEHGTWHWPEREIPKLNPL